VTIHSSQNDFEIKEITMSTMTSPLPRLVLDEKQQKPTVDTLQRQLYNLVDLALLLKQAHWNVLGRNFRSIHLQLDEILETVRDASDDVAERIAAIGSPADGRSAAVAEHSELQNYSDSFEDVSSTVAAVADALKTTIDGMRAGIETLGDTDPISEDLCIGIAGQLEKHLWMLQAHEA
jgi:starvation-inducible DNA-binding protein